MRSSEAAAGRWPMPCFALPSTPVGIGTLPGPQMHVASYGIRGQRVIPLLHAAHVALSPIVLQLVVKHDQIWANENGTWTACLAAIYVV
jgi:hypothetical protein